jgi:co-chaperonin GroES (HSP10)
MYSAFLNFAVFRTDRLSNDDTKFKGNNGLNLVVDTSWDPKKHVCTSGEVVSIPKHLSNVLISQKHKGLPAYDSYSPYSYRYLSDITLEIQPGDRIYFHFNTIRPQNLIKKEKEGDKTWYYFKVRIDQIICAVRGGVVIPTSTYTLVEPDMETWEDIFVPTYSNIKGPDGKFILKPKDQWLQKKVMPEKKYLLGFVRHVGTPYKGETCDVSVGDRIVYRRSADWTNAIEGKDYFAILQRHIIAKYVDGQLVPVGGNIFIDPEIEADVTEAGLKKVKLDICQRGTVTHPGKSSMKTGDFVEFGESDRNPLDMDGKKFLAMDAGNIWGTWIAKTA